MLAVLNTVGTVASGITFFFFYLVVPVPAIYGEHKDNNSVATVMIFV